MTKKDLIEQIRLLMMGQAYDYADDGNDEAYGATKVVCNKVLVFLDELLVDGPIEVTK